MNTKEKKEVNGLTKDLVKKIEDLFKSYRLKIAEIIEVEEEKAERIEEYFYSSDKVDAIQESIEMLEDTLAVFEEAVEMMKEVEYV